MKRLIYFFVSSLLMLILACSEDNVTKSTESELSFSYKQITGCNESTNQLAKSSYQDSCFTYSFNDKLKIDFCVYGNCCPDSQRFVVDYSIESDTIFVEVADTAENLCYCICSYAIHIEITGLERNRYLFYCNFPSEDSAHYGNLYYREYVYKK